MVYDFIAREAPKKEWYIENPSEERNRELLNYIGTLMGFDFSR